MYQAMPAMGPLSGLGGRGMFGARKPTNPVGLMPQPMQEQPRRGGALRGIAGTIGDALLQMNGLRPVYAPAMQQQREEQALNRQLQQRQMLADMEARQPVIREVGGSIVSIDPSTGQSRVLHQAPSRPEVFEDNSGNRWERGPDGQNRMVFFDPTVRYDNQVVTREDGSRELIRVPRPNAFNPDGTPASGVTTPTSGPQPGDVVGGYRFRGGNPNDRNNWEPTGGATPTASGNFQR